MEEYCDAEQLIKLVKQRRALYDHTLRDHSNKSVIEELWSEIAAIMNCPVSDCRSKWANLRCAYGRHLRQERGTPYSIRNKRRKTWYMAEAMAFLECHMAHNRIPSKKKLYNGYVSNSFITPSSSFYPKYEQSPNISMQFDSPLYPKREPSVHLSEDETSTPNFTSGECTSSISSQFSTSTKLQSQQQQQQTQQQSSQQQQPQHQQQQQQPTSEKKSGTRFEVICDRDDSEDSDSMFFKSLLADYKELSKKSKRQFREQMVITLNKLQEEEEREELRSHVKIEFV